MGFSANMVYGSLWDAGTMGVPAWVQRRSPNAPQAYTGLASTTSFSGRPSMGFGMGSGAPAGAFVGMVNRGLGGTGMSFVGGQTYEVGLWVWSGGSPTGFVELNDFTSGTTLARQEFTVVSTGPAWGSTWEFVQFNITPSEGACVCAVAWGDRKSVV